jgi:hypothetical protein
LDRERKFEEPVEMKTVENLRCNAASHFRSKLDSVGRIIDFRFKSGGLQLCGKVVNSMWTARRSIGYFSLAPDVSFRQNPARAVNPVAVLGFDLKRRAG